MKTRIQIIIFIAIVAFLSTVFWNAATAQNGLRINKTEFFTVSTSIDPSASIKEKGFDVVGEIEYAGLVYIKAGFESFSALHGGYTDIHGAVGINLTSGYFEQWRYYAGARISNVWRDGGFGTNYGLESGIDYNVSDNFFIGLRAVYDYRLEQKAIYGWNPEMKFNGFIRIGYRWNFKK